MTGFGTGSVAYAGGSIVAEVRSVNQRFLDVRVKLPREMADLGLFVEQLVRERVRRGRVELVVHTEGAVQAAAVLDKERARAAFRALAELRDELCPGAELPLSVLGAMPDLFSASSAPDEQALRGAVREAVERAVASMNEMFHREGEATAADLRARAERLEALGAEVAARADATKPEARRRLRERLLRVLTDADIPVEGARIEAEIVLLTERGDIAEELSRLASHLVELGRMLGGDQPEPVGRKLDFLLQEMMREVNTIGSKAQDAQISQQVVAMKVELERLREQVQNIE
ncbi:MAG: YicC/YloC family endoribonuclease [Byssovorax sp.]